MSGTSLDGVDAALVDFAAPLPRVLATHFAPFDPALRSALLALQQAGPNELDRAARAANDLVRAYATGVSAVLKVAAMTSSQVRAIGSHGQTVRHQPAAGYTLQLDNPALLAELTGIDVVADFRRRDVAAGGQGAPLAPAFHRAFFAAPDQARVVLNIGGIANVTLLTGDGTTSGFDTGPGNVLMDAWCHRHLGHGYDAGGAWAAGGQVLPALLQVLLAEPYFAAPPPKSTGRDLFNPDWVDAILANLPGASLFPPRDVQATLLELTAASIANQITRSGARAVYACGGGAANEALMARLSRLLAPAPVRTTADLGIPADWVEAVAFAWLARQHVERIPANLPEVTGASGARGGARILGALYPA